MFKGSRYLFQTISLGIHVSFRGCISCGMSPPFPLIEMGDIVWTPAHCFKDEPQSSLLFLPKTEVNSRKCPSLKKKNWGEDSRKGKRGQKSSKQIHYIKLLTSCIDFFLRILIPKNPHHPAKNPHHPAKNPHHPAKLWRI